MEAARAVENKTNTIRIIIDHLDSFHDLVQLEVLDFVEFLKTRQMQYEERKTDEESWGDLSLESAMKGMEDEDTPYTSADIIVPCT